MCIKNSLHKAYKNNTEFRKFILSLIALANLPHGDMEDVFYLLAKNARQIAGLSVFERYGIRKICRHFITYWMPKADILTTWGATFRTNNPVENINRWVKVRMGGAHPTFYNFAGFTADYYDEQTIVLGQILGGHCPASPESDVARGQRQHELSYTKYRCPLQFLTDSSRELSELEMEECSTARAMECEDGDDHLVLGSAKCDVCYDDLVDAVACIPCNHQCCISCYSRLNENPGFPCFMCRTIVQGCRTQIESLQPDRAGNLPAEEWMEKIEPVRRPVGLREEYLTGLNWLDSDDDFV
jgi:hypothetical protein